LKKIIRKDNNNMKQIINRLPRTTLQNLKNKHPKSFKGVTLKDINLFIACYRNFNYEPMQITKLYLKKSVAYCILLEYFTAERRL